MVVNKITPSLSTYPIGTKVKLSSMVDAAKNPETEGLFAALGIVPDSVIQIDAKVIGSTVVKTEDDTYVGVRNPTLDKFLFKVEQMGKEKIKRPLFSDKLKAIWTSVKGKIHK